MKYAHYDKTHKIIGYYDSHIHKHIPEPNISISDEAWQKAINKNATHVDLINNTLYKKEIEPNKVEAELNEALNYANELKENIRNALILGNDEAINNLRDEYKELLTHIQTLKGADNEQV